MIRDCDVNQIVEKKAFTDTNGKINANSAVRFLRVDKSGSLVDLEFWKVVYFVWSCCSVSVRWKGLPGAWHWLLQQHLEIFVVLWVSWGFLCF